MLSPEVADSGPDLSADQTEIKTEVDPTAAGMGEPLRMMNSVISTVLSRT
jgi:hypothetical protein